MNIRGLKQEVALHHLVSAIRPSCFTESLIKKLPQDMEDLRTRATKFMQIEEHIDYHQRFKAVGSGVLKDQTPSKEREFETGPFEPPQGPTGTEETESPGLTVTPL